MASDSENRYFWKIDRWNGGLSEDSRIGLPGAFRYGLGLDYRSDSGLLKVANKPVKDSDTTVDQIVKWIEINPANGDMYAYAGDEIYKETGGTYSVARTLSGDSPNGQGLCDFNGYLYFRKATVLGRFDYASTWTESYQTGLTSTSTFSPMCRFKNLLLVGHGRYVATLDDIATWTLARLTLPPGYVVRSIFRAGSFAVILAIRGSAVADSEEGLMFLWNGTSDQYNDVIPLDGNPHAGISHNNKIIIIAGTTPSIQESLGGMFDIVYTLPNVGDGKTAEVFPGAIDLWRNMVHFGISDGTSTTLLRAIYNWGSRNKKFPDTLNPEFPISTGTLTGTGVQITAVKRIGTTIRYAWKDGSSYGIDEIDTAQFQTSGIYRSLAFDRTSPYFKTGVRIMVELANKINTNETVTCKISPDPYEDPTFAVSAEIVSATLSTVDARVLEIALVSDAIPIRSRDLHLELTLGGSAATKPVVKRVWTEIIEDSDQM